MSAVRPATGATPARLAAARRTRQAAIGRHAGILTDAGPAAVLAVYERSDPAAVEAGRRWWADVHEHAACLARLHELSGTAAAVGVLAALSPQSPWAANVTLADDVLAHVAEHGLRRPDLAPCGPSGMDATAKAMACAAGVRPTDVLRGRKVRAFYAAAARPDRAGPVCVDRHAVAILAGRPHVATRDRLLERPGVYARAAAAYRAAARTAGMRPHEMQAVTWLTWRAEHAPGWSARDALAELLGGGDPGAYGGPDF